MTAACASVPRSTGRGGGDVVERLGSLGILGCRELGLPADTKDRQRGGERAASEVLEDFLTLRGRHYSGGSSSPVSAATSCSRLSPALAFGAISMRRVWQATEARRLDVQAALAKAGSPREKAECRAWQRSLKGVQSRLHWHCHFMQKLEDEPAIEFKNMLRAADGLRESEVVPERLAAWQSGHTGYPLVDACMRSLLATGWLTFRMRALLVSFASYSLWLHWRPTGLHLARHFLDFEPGIHWSQLQMQSGTTASIRCGSIIPRSRRSIRIRTGYSFAAGCRNSRVLPPAFVHMPWTMPVDVQQTSGCIVGRDYPAPLVDHAVAVREAKRRLAIVRNAPESRAEAREVARRHGSRKDRRGAMQQDPVRRTLFGDGSDVAGRSKRRPSPPVHDPQQLLPFLTEDLATEVAQDTQSENR